MITYICLTCSRTFDEDETEEEVECAWCGSTDVDVT